MAKRKSPPPPTDSALTVAAQSGDLARTRDLLLEEARPDADDNAAILAAARGGHTEVLDLLLTHLLRYVPDIDPIGYRIESGFGDVRHQSTIVVGEGRSVKKTAIAALVAAAESKQTQTVLHILQLRDDLMPADVQLACDSAIGAGAVETVGKLLADTSLPEVYRKQVRKTLLNGAKFVQAVEWGDIPMVTCLLDSEPTLVQNESALRAAVRADNTALAGLLLARGAEVNPIGHGNPRQLLADAAAGGQVDMVQLLLDNGACIDHKKYAAAKNALHAGANGVVILRKFLAHGLSVNAHGDVLTKEAAKHGLLDAMALLLKAGAPLGPLNSAKGKTAREVAIEHGRQAVIAMLDASALSASLATSGGEDASAIVTAPSSKL